MDVNITATEKDGMEELDLPLDAGNPQSDGGERGLTR